MSNRIVYEKMCLVLAKANKSMEWFQQRTELIDNFENFLPGY